MKPPSKCICLLGTMSVVRTLKRQCTTYRVGPFTSHPPSLSPAFRHPLDLRSMVPLAFFIEFPSRAHIFDLHIPYSRAILPPRCYRVLITGLHPVVTRFLKTQGTSNNWWRKMEKGHQPLLQGISVIWTGTSDLEITNT